MYSRYSANINCEVSKMSQTHTGSKHFPSNNTNLPDYKQTKKET